MEQFVSIMFIHGRTSYKLLYRNGTQSIYSLPKELRNQLEMHIRCIIYKCYILQHPDICLLVKAMADKFQWTIQVFIPIPLEKKLCSL